jgi:hypothetical protein
VYNVAGAVIVERSPTTPRVVQPPPPPGETDSTLKCNSTLVITADGGIDDRLNTPYPRVEDPKIVVALIALSDLRLEVAEPVV